LKKNESKNETLFYIFIFFVLQYYENVWMNEILFWFFFKKTIRKIQINNYKNYFLNLRIN